MMNSRLAKGFAGMVLCAVSLAASAATDRLSEEVDVRQDLIQVAFGKQNADLIIRGANVLNAFTAAWVPNQDIVIKGKRIAWVGPAGQWPGAAETIVDAEGLWAVPGFGESHKHIESSYLTPEYEAALVIPGGNTWTVEGSHELSNVVGMKNVEFWLSAEDAGSPLKIFPAIGSATPPTVYEKAGGYYGYDEMRTFLKEDLRVVALGEVMDWPAVSNPEAEGNERIWGMIKATWEQRAVIEGHGAGLTSVNDINAFAAAGLSSDHEVRDPQEGIEKLRAGVFLEIRADTARVFFPKLLASGIRDWSNISITTDDRDVAATLALGAMDYNVRNAISAGAPPEQAFLMASYNTARHFNIDHLVGSIAPGRYADVVLISDIDKVRIERVYANGRLASQRLEGEPSYLLPVPKIDYPSWSKNTMNVGKRLIAEDFAVYAPTEASNVTAALMQPFYFLETFPTGELPVVDGQVHADPSSAISKVAVVDRYSGEGKVAKMFWRNVGPLNERSALASSQMHDIHNIWVLGNDDAAMALAANTVADMQGGWALVNEGRVVATVSLDIAGLMTARPVAEVAEEVEALQAAADQMSWIGGGGLPERMRFAFLTASPWKWQLVAPYDGNEGGFVNVTTGETHPVVW